MKAVKQFYIIISIILVSILQSCDGTKEPIKDNDWYITQKDLDEFEFEIPDSSGSISFSKEELKGMRLYMQHCNSCHPGGERGKGPPLIEKEVIPDILIHFQVRNGLGDMPAFNKEDLPKDDVKKIISFVSLLRENAERD